MYELKNVIGQRLKTELGFILESSTEIKAGGNNRLFKLSSSNRNLLLKIYTTHDNRQRLQREFQAFSYLRTHGFLNIPEAFFKDDTLNYAVYSFEDGITKSAENLTRDDLNQMLGFVLKLQDIQPDTVSEYFMPAVSACTCLQDYIKNITARVEKFKHDSKRAHTSENIQELRNSGYEHTISDLVCEAIHQYTHEELTKPIDQKDMRLSPVDFGPHNMVFKPDGTATFLDFEYFGWDDPCKLVVDFLDHDQSTGISEVDKTYFLETYLERSTVSPEILTRVKTVSRLISIEWLTCYLATLTNEKLSIRAFADPEFNEVEYIEKQVKKYWSKLESLHKLA